MDILTAILPPVSALLGVGLGAWLQHRAENVREERRRREAWLERTSAVVEEGLAAVHKRGELKDAARRLFGLSIAHPDPEVASAAFDAGGDLERFSQGPDVPEPVKSGEVVESLAHLAARARRYAYDEDAPNDVWGAFLDREDNAEKT